MSTEPFDDEQISRMIAFFADRLNLVFAHFFCTIEFDGDEDFRAAPTLENFKNPRIQGLRMIRSACLHTTLIALRDLGDVLSQRPKSKPDDLRASDFGYPPVASFLAPCDRNSINKAIAHSTTFDVAASQRWNIDTLVMKCVQQSLTFLRWLEENRDWSFTAFFCRTGIESTYGYLTKRLKEIRTRDAL